MDIWHAFIRDRDVIIDGASQVLSVLSKDGTETGWAEESIGLAS